MELFHNLNIKLIITKITLAVFFHQLTTAKQTIFACFGKCLEVVSCDAYFLISLKKKYFYHKQIYYQGYFLFAYSTLMQLSFD